MKGEGEGGGGRMSSWREDGRGEGCWMVGGGWEGVRGSLKV